jgi:hypothetical protein
MQERVPCEPVSLAQHGCCEVLLCPQCDAIHLHIGPLSLKLPPEALRQVSAATAEAEKALRQYQPDVRTPQPDRPEAKLLKH